MSERSGDGDEIATLALKPAIRPADEATAIDPPSRPRPPRARTAALVRPAPRAADALHAEEAARARAIGLVLAVLCPAALIGMPFQIVPHWLSLMMATTVIVLMLTSIWMWRRARDSARYGRTVFRIYAIVSFFAGHVVLFYGGYFSATLVVALLGLSFFATGDDRKFVLILGTLFVACYALVGILMAVGVIPDHSLFPISSIGIEAKLFLLAMSTACIIVLIWHARLARQATRDAFEQLASALKAVQERDALLEEADQNLDLARKLDAGKRGRYSGARAGSYSLTELVGRGAMGEVYAAMNKETGQRAAVKVLAESAHENPGFLERFRREARIATQLRSENLVRVFEVGEIEADVPFMAMELLTGHDLAWHLRKRRRLPAADVIVLVQQVARGVQAAHEAGIVHRDVKPNNLFLDETDPRHPVWKVLDFGISKERESSATLTQEAVIGTPGYMSPEQARAKTAVAGSDVFSLGAVAYRALTGRLPFAGTDVPQILYQLVHEQPPQPSRLVEGLRPEVDAVLAVALAKNPGARFASPIELADALELALGGQLGGELRRRAETLLARQPWGDSVPEEAPPNP